MYSKKSSKLRNNIALTKRPQYDIVVFSIRRILEVFGDVAGAPPPLLLMPAPNTLRVFFCPREGSVYPT